MDKYNTTMTVAVSYRALTMAAAAAYARGVPFYEVAREFGVPPFCTWPYIAAMRTMAYGDARYFGGP